MADVSIAARRLAVWRKSKDLSQEQAAQLAGVSQATWSTWEVGEAVPRLHAAFEVQRLTRGLVRARDWLAPEDPAHHVSVSADDAPRKVGT